MEKNRLCDTYSCHPEDSKASQSKQSRLKRCFHLVLGRRAAKRALGRNPSEEKKQAFAASGLLLRAKDARRLARNPHEW